MTSYQVFLD